MPDDRSLRLKRCVRIGTTTPPTPHYASTARGHLWGSHLVIQYLRGSVSVMMVNIKREHNLTQMSGVFSAGLVTKTIKDCKHTFLFAQ